MKSRKRIFGITLIIASIGSLYFVPWLLVKAWILPLPDSLQDQANQAVEYGFEGVIAYVDQAGQSPQFIASGYHNRELKTPATPHAYFKIASISKLYNAVAVTKLVHRGRLSLDKTLAAYLPELRGRIENADRITLRMMIQHRSGIPNYTDAPNYWSTPGMTYEENLALILDQSAHFEPDSDYEYCNTNYLLIQKILEETLSYGSFQFIQEEILSPLSLNHTFSSVNDVDSSEVMSGYHLGHPYDLKKDDYGMIATAEDVGTFIRALNEGTLFEPGEREIYSSIYEYEHGGWVPGYQSFAKYYEDMDAVIVTFYSTTDSDLYYWNLSEIINSRIAKIVARQNL